MSGLTLYAQQRIDLNLYVDQQALLIHGLADTPVTVQDFEERTVGVAHPESIVCVYNSATRPYLASGSTLVRYSSAASDDVREASG